MIISMSLNLKLSGRDNESVGRRIGLSYKSDEIILGNFDTSPKTYHNVIDVVAAFIYSHPFEIPFRSCR